MALERGRVTVVLVVSVDRAGRTLLRAGRHNGRGSEGGGTAHPGRISESCPVGQGGPGWISLLRVKTAKGTGSPSRKGSYVLAADLDSRRPVSRPRNDASGHWQGRPRNSDSPRPVQMPTLALLC